MNINNSGPWPGLQNFWALPFPALGSSWVWTLEQPGPHGLEEPQRPGLCHFSRLVISMLPGPLKGDGVLMEEMS